ncbi:hypothetical protein HK096_005361 [Nowakowskiella sp. JEL0078]|nr:hypothetical protein HK096_005361 [Nowakowskiella sp. JEL0078]
MVGGNVGRSGNSWKATNEIWFLHISNTTDVLHDLSVSEINNPVFLSPSFPPGKLFLKSETPDFITIKWDDDWSWIPDRSYYVWIRHKSPKKQFSRHIKNWQQIFEGNSRSCSINIEAFDDKLEIVVGASGPGKLINTRFMLPNKNQLEIVEFNPELKSVEKLSLEQPVSEYTPYLSIDPSKQLNNDCTQLNFDCNISMLANDKTLIKINSTETESKCCISISYDLEQPTKANNCCKQQIHDEEIIVLEKSTKRTRDDEDNVFLVEPKSNVQYQSIINTQESQIRGKDKKRKNSGKESRKSSLFINNQSLRGSRKSSNNASPDIEFDYQSDDTVLELEDWMVFDAKRCRDEEVNRYINGLPVDQGFPFNLVWGAKIDVYSVSDSNWYPAFALAYEKVTISDEKFSWKLRVHFEGYSKQFDLSIDLFSGDEIHTSEELNKDTVRKRLKSTERFFKTLNLKNEIFVLEANIVYQHVLKGLMNLKETELALKKIPVIRVPKDKK